MSDWPENLLDFAFIPNMEEKLNDLTELAEPEQWDYENTPSDRKHPILYNYLRYTYKRVADENKIFLSKTGEYSSWNTGLVTPGQESIFFLVNKNFMPDAKQLWHFQKFCRKGERDLVGFSELPDLASYFDDPKVLVFDYKKEIRANIEHIANDNRDRFPEPYKGMNIYTLQTIIKGAIDNARERVRRNYKTAIPHFYQSRVQLMLPLCISSPQKADLALVIEDHGNFYRAATCLTLDMAYNNARLLARPDKDWLQP